jgi:membrane protease YdiL (CAAX protease family)
MLFVNIQAQSGQTLSTSKSLQQIMREHPLFFFFLLSYGFSWIISLPYLLSVWGILSGDYTLALYLKQWLGPALAAVIMTRISGEKMGMVRLRHRIRQWRVHWIWYLFILLGIPALILLGIIILRGTFVDFQVFPPRILMNYPMYFVGIFFATGLPEEIGWRGFALPRMQRRYGSLRGSVLLGVLWAFWHLLSFFLPSHGGGPNVSFAAILINFLVFSLMVVALTVIFTWVFNHTQGSIFIASLVHTAINVPQLAWAPLFFEVGLFNSTAGELALNQAYLIGFGMFALLLLILTPGRLGYQPTQEEFAGVRTSKVRAAV